MDNYYIFNLEDYNPKALDTSEQLLLALAERLERIADLMEKEQNRRICPHCKGDLVATQLQGPSKMALYCSFCGCALLANGTVYVASCEKGREQLRQENEANDG